MGRVGMMFLETPVSHPPFTLVFHRLENFLFESKEPDAALKLIDFGLSHKYGATFRRMHTMVRGLCCSSVAGVA
jgi:hypothetical protein